jgi:hypothetical protein
MISESDLTIRIFGMSGDLVAAYAQATVLCAMCDAKPGDKCKKSTPTRSVCPSRFKYAINVLDDKCSKVIIAELAKANQPRLSHVGDYMTCEACTAEFGRQVTRAARDAHNAALGIIEGKYTTTTRVTANTIPDDLPEIDPWKGGQ